MKIMIGIPARRFDNLEQIADNLKWSWGMEEKHDLRWYIDRVYGVDAARSRIIEEAKRWGAELLLMIDTDIQVRLEWRQVLSVISQAFSRGYGLVISPTISVDGQIMVWAPLHQTPFGTPKDVPVGSAFEIAWGALGFAAFKGEALHKLKVLGNQTFVNGPPAPLYCLYTPGGSGEDHSLCDNFRENTGLKIAADTRLMVDHYKLLGRPSWRGMEFMPPTGFNLEKKESAIQGPS
jgi:hypothetical protein